VARRTRRRAGVRAGRLLRAGGGRGRRAGRGPRGADPIERASRLAVRVALAGAILGFVPGLLDSFASPKAALLRALGLPLLVLALARGVSRLGGLLRQPGEALAALRPRDAAGGADLAAAAVALVACASALAGLAPRASVFGEIGQREGVLTTLSLAGLYFGARASHRGPAHVRATLGVALAAGALAAAYALVQFAGLDPLAWENPSRYAGVIRPGGTLGNAILLGGLLAGALAGATAVIAARPGAATRVAPPLALAGAALMATLSRGAWLAAAAGLAVAALPGLVRPRAGARGRAALALTLAALPALAFGALALREALRARLAEGPASGATSAPARLAIARGALELWRAHPWLGTGPDTFGLAFTRVQTPDLARHAWFGSPLHAHSALLQVLATLGLLGVLALIAWFAAAGLARRARARATNDPALPSAQRATTAGEAAIAPAAVALAVAGLFNPIGLAGAASLAVLAALATGGRPAGGPPERPGLGAVAALLVAGFAVVAGVREMEALADAGRARAALIALVGAPASERGYPAEAARDAAWRAAGAWPFDDELRRLECDAAIASATAGLEGGVPSRAMSDAALEAEAAAEAARRAVPARSANLQRVADAAIARARLEAPHDTAQAGRLVARAESAFASARALAPADGLLLVDQVRGELSVGRTGEALAAAEHLARLYPESATGHALVAAALLADGRPEPARDALERALAARWEEGSEAQRAEAERMLARLGGPRR
jgi:O-antigen ligase